MSGLPAWLSQAACLDAPDPDLFFDGRGRRGYTDALAVCATCPVAPQCLTTALENETDLSPRHRYGVWGGLTPEERASR